MTSMVISSVSHKQPSTTAHGQRPRAAGERQARQEDAQQAQPRWRPQHGQGHRGRSATPLKLAIVCWSLFSHLHRALVISAAPDCFTLAPAHLLTLAGSPARCFSAEPPAVRFQAQLQPAAHLSPPSCHAMCYPCSLRNLHDPAIILFLRHAGEKKERERK